MALDKRLNMRVTPERKRLIELAAKHQGITVSEFVRRAALDAAASVLVCGGEDAVDLLSGTRAAWERLS